MDERRGMDMTKLLGVDYGEARTGLARSDALGLYAVGMGHIKSYRMDKTAAEIVRIAKENGIGRIVIGKPVNMNGTCGEKVEKVMELARLIGELSDIPVDFYDERMTTMSAHKILSESGIRAKNRREVVDSLAAELILQGYMDKNRNML